MIIFVTNQVNFIIYRILSHDVFLVTALRDILPTKSGK